MALPFLVLVLAGLFLIGTLLVWLVRRLLKRETPVRHLAKFATIGFLVALPLFLFLALPLIISSLLASASTRPQDRLLTRTPRSCGAVFSEAAFQTEDGVTIRGWYLPGADDKPTFIMAHGLFRNRIEVLELACRLNSIGYPSLLFDFRSHGISGRDTVTLGHREKLDVLAACTYALEQQDGDLVLYGISMGAVSCLMAAPEVEEKLAAVVADSPFLSLRETIRRHTWLVLSLPAFPFVDIFVWNFTRVGDFSETDLNAVKAAAKLREVPILLIYGERDRRMPETVAQAFFSEIDSPRKLVFFPKAGHGRSFRSDPGRYVKEVVDFLNR